MQEQKEDKPTPAEQAPPVAPPPEDAVAGGGLAARLARKILAAPPRHVVRLNLEMLQLRIDTELRLWLDGDARLNLEKGTVDPTSGKFVWNNPLPWWCLHEPEFPTISVLARHVLAVPASEAPCERVFSALEFMLILAG